MRLISSNKKESLELKKHVGLIHSVNKLSLLERKIANALLFNAYEMLLTKTEHQIHISDLANLIGYDSNDHKVLKKSLMSLISTVMEWNILDKDRTLIFDLGVTGAPETFLIDAQGIIRYHHIGDINPQIWQQKLAAAYQSLQE